MKTSEKIKITGMTALIIRGKKILCVKRKTDPWKGMLSLPGGKLEQGETEIEGLLREVKEETGYIIDLLEKEPVVISRIKYKGQPAIYKIYECVIKDGIEYPQEEEVEEIVWTDVGTFLNNIKLHGFNLIAANQLETYFKKRGLLK